MSAQPLSKSEAMEQFNHLAVELNKAGSTKEAKHNFEKALSLIYQIHGIDGINKLKSEDVAKLVPFFAKYLAEMTKETRPTIKDPLTDNESPNTELHKILVLLNKASGPPNDSLHHFYKHAQPILGHKDTFVKACNALSADIEKRLKKPNPNLINLPAIPTRPSYTFNPTTINNAEKIEQAKEAAIKACNAYLKHVSTGLRGFALWHGCLHGGGEKQIEWLLQAIQERNLRASSQDFPAKDPKADGLRDHAIKAFETWKGLATPASGVASLAKGQTSRNPDTGNSIN